MIVVYCMYVVAFMIHRTTRRGQASHKILVNADQAQDWPIEYHAHACMYCTVHVGDRHRG
jgi:hypothetical protein